MIIIYIHHCNQKNYVVIVKELYDKDEYLFTRKIKAVGLPDILNENINDYDEIFEELQEKYGGGTDMAPELRLMFI